MIWSENEERDLPVFSSFPPALALQHFDKASQISVFLCEIFSQMDSKRFKKENNGDVCNIVRECAHITAICEHRTSAFGLTRGLSLGCMERWAAAPSAATPLSLVCDHEARRPHSSAGESMRRDDQREEISFWKRRSFGVSAPPWFPKRKCVLSNTRCSG